MNGSKINKERALRGLHAVKGHANSRIIRGHELEEQAIDTIADVLHLLTAKGFNERQVESILDLSAKHWCHEISGEGE
jgi:hypothetical protein